MVSESRPLASERNTNLVIAQFPEPRKPKGEMTMLQSLRSRSIGSFQIPALLVVLFLSAHAAFGQAQSNAADIQGTIKDANGAVVPNATVTARNPNTNIARTATSND